MNIWRTLTLLAVMTALFMSVGYLIGGGAGMVIAFCLSVAMNLFSYWNSDKLVLRLYKAREVRPDDHSPYYRIVTDLAERANLPCPRIYLIDNPQPNAFATGRNPQNAAVAATTGLLARLNHQEIAGVMAHELAHIEHRDTLTMTITATLAGAVAMLGNFAYFFGRGRANNPLGMMGTLAAMIVAPFAAMLVQMAISRTREYAADRRGAQICGNPLWLAAALQKISAHSQTTLNHQAEENPATAHMFIINPLSRRGADSLFSTHPATQNRIAALTRLADEMGITHLGVVGAKRAVCVQASRKHGIKPTPKTIQRPGWMKIRQGQKQNPNKKRGPWG